MFGPEGIAPRGLLKHVATSGDRKSTTTLQGSMNQDTEPAGILQQPKQHSLQELQRVLLLVCVVAIFHGQGHLVALQVHRQDLHPDLARGFRV